MGSWQNSTALYRGYFLNKQIVFLAVALSLFFGMGQLPSSFAGEEGEQRYQQPLQEVFQTEVVYPQGKGEVQMTTAPRFREGDAANLTEIPLSIEYGITDAWQLELKWNAFVNRNPPTGATTRGIGDLEFGTKYSFMNIANSDFHTAIGLDIGFPTGNPEDGLGEGMMEYEPFVSLAYDFPRLNNSQIFTQVAVGFVHRVRGDEEAAHEVTWNTGFFVPFWQLRWTTEFNWTTNEWNDGDENDMFITLGLVWDLPKTWEVGLGVPVGLNDDADNFRIIAMLTYEFNVLGKDED